MVNIVFSTSNRIDLFEDTIKSLIEHNPGINKLIKNVYILDDRSVLSSRSIMDLLLQKYFPNKGRLITFNDSSHQFAYVEKLNFIQNITSDTKYTLFIEEDWRSLAPLDLTSHIQHLENHPDIDQIIFSEHYWFQDKDVKEKTFVNETYWDHSKTKVFKHTYDFKIGDDGNMYYIWFTARPIFTLNPTLNRNTLYKKGTFPLNKNYEEDFSKQVSAKQILTQQAKFVHTGANQSVEGKSWG